MSSSAAILPKHTLSSPLFSVALNLDHEYVRHQSDASQPFHFKTTTRLVNESSV
jgi:hypothetical protein